MKPTFNQIFAASMAVLFFIGLILILFIPMHGNPTYQSGIIIAFSSGMTGCIGYLIGSTSGSQAKDDVISKANDALANSTPIIKNS